MGAQIILENVGVRYPSRVLFESVNWTLYEGMRVALAGRNGSGKSTLLKILAGQLEPSEGKRTVVGSKKIKIGFLDQAFLDEAVVQALQMKDRSHSPLQVIKENLSKQAQEHQLEEVEQEWEIKKTLSGLGFSVLQMESPIN
ncbi:MAG: ABC-F family ATP-binding cassette domain-containing protein, partial [Deltaproteobacteria bacterium]|nr:ABC-F family ATP-binding cassette domain-containing protein [Deltaproteobacteria bacterium]